MRVLLAILVASAALAAPAAAQKATPAAPPAKQEQQAPKLHPLDQRFFLYMADGGMAEVEAGKLAEQKASNGNVKDFGRRMGNDHGKANAKLEKWANAKGIAMPAKMGEQHQKVQGQLQAANGVEFDRIYVNNQIDEHQKTVRVLEEHIRIGRDSQLRAFASEKPQEEPAKPAPAQAQKQKPKKKSAPEG
jgi:putative membrane protein